MAGRSCASPPTSIPTNIGAAFWEIDLSAQFVLGRGREMLNRGAGKIIFTASLLSFQGGITVPGYAAAKGGVAQVTKALANEWTGRNVQVTAIAPGSIATDNTSALRNDPARNQAILGRIPASRWGESRGFRRRGGLPGFQSSRFLAHHRK